MEATEMSKIDEIVNDQRVFVGQIDKKLAALRADIIRTASTKKIEEKEQLMKEILGNMNRLISLVAAHGTGNHKENIILFIEMAYNNASDSENMKRITLLKIREHLLYLLKDTTHDIESKSSFGHRKERINILKNDLKTVGIQEDLITEIMDEVYSTLRQLSATIAEYIRKKGGNGYVEAKMGLYYLSLIPGVTEEEINNFLKPDGGLPDILKKERKRYLLAIKRPAPLIKVGQNIIGIYEGNPIIAKIKKINDHAITCDVCSNGTLGLTELNFNPASLMSNKQSGFLWQTMSDLEWADPNTLKPKTKNNLPQYSTTVIIRWKSKEKENIGIGYYVFDADHWTIAIQGSSGCINIPAKEIVAWTYVPADIKDEFEDYNIKNEE